MFIHISHNSSNIGLAHILGSNLIISHCACRWHRTLRCYVMSRHSDVEQEQQFLPQCFIFQPSISHILFPNFIWEACMHDPVILTGWQMCSFPDLTIIPLCPSLLLMWVSLSWTLLLTIHHCHWFWHTLCQQVNGRDVWKHLKKCNRNERLMTCHPIVISLLFYRTDKNFTDIVRWNKDQFNKM